ncbi:MAG: hypothetical protein ABR519_01525 [Bacteroidales bacterium]
MEREGEKGFLEREESCDVLFSSAGNTEENRLIDIRFLNDV